MIENAKKGDKARRSSFASVKPALTKYRIGCRCNFEVNGKGGVYYVSFSGSHDIRCKSTCNRRLNQAVLDYFKSRLTIGMSASAALRLFLSYNKENEETRVTTFCSKVNDYAGIKVITIALSKCELMSLSDK